MHQLWEDTRSTLRSISTYLRFTLTTATETLADWATFTSILTEPFVMSWAWIREDRNRHTRIEKTVIFIRHPHTNDEDDGIYRGDHAQITQKGLEEAAIIAERIASASLVTHIVTSTLERSRQLAQIIALAVSRTGIMMPAFIPSDLFVEIRKPSELVDVHRKDPETVRISARHRRYFDLEYRYSDEENRWRVERRLFRSLKFLAELDAKYVVVVSHGKFLRALWHYIYCGGRFRRFYAEADLVLDLEHTGLVIIKMKKSFRHGTPRWMLSTWNDVAHQDRPNIEDLLRQLDAKTTTPP